MFVKTQRCELWPIIAAALLVAFFSQKHPQGELISDGEQSVSAYINPAKTLGCSVLK